MPVKRLSAPPSPSFCLSFIFRPIFSQLYFVVPHFKAEHVGSFEIISMYKKHRGDSGVQEKGTALAQGLFFHQGFIEKEPTDTVTQTDTLASRLPLRLTVTLEGFFQLLHNK